MQNHPDRGGQPIYKQRSSEKQMKPSWQLKQRLDFFSSSFLNSLEAGILYSQATKRKQTTFRDIIRY